MVGGFSVASHLRRMRNTRGSLVSKIRAMLFSRPGGRRQQQTRDKSTRKTRIRPGMLSNRLVCSWLGDVAGPVTPAVTPDAVVAHKHAFADDFLPSSPLQGQQQEQEQQQEHGSKSVPAKETKLCSVESHIPPSTKNTSLNATEQWVWSREDAVRTQEEKQADIDWVAPPSPHRVELGMGAGAEDTVIDARTVSFNNVVKVRYRTHPPVFTCAQV